MCVIKMIIKNINKYFQEASTMFPVTKKQILYIFTCIALVVILYKLIQDTIPLTYSVYEKNIYDPLLFDEIKSMCGKIPREQLHLDNKAIGRMMYTFPITDPIYSLIYNPAFIQKVRQLTGNNTLLPCLQVPIEYRKYLIGSYMNWHRDTQMLPDQLQYECIITLTNTSDSLTLMDKILWTQRISSEPNSLVIVRAKGINHKVTETTTGERTILKIVFCTK